MEILSKHQKQFEADGVKKKAPWVADIKSGFKGKEMGLAMKFAKFKMGEFHQMGWDALSTSSMFDEKKLLEDNMELLC